MDAAVQLHSDLHQWALDTAEALRGGRFEGIDWSRVAEEIESLAGSEERALEARLTQLIFHLLKIEFQPERHGRSWDLTVREQRRAIYRLIQRQPSLRPLLSDREVIDAAYGDALAEAGRENLPDAVVMRFPEVCPYDVSVLLPEL